MEFMDMLVSVLIAAYAAIVVLFVLIRMVKAASWQEIACIVGNVITIHLIYIFGSLAFGYLLWGDKWYFFTMEFPGRWLWVLMLFHIQLTVKHGLLWELVFDIRRPK